MFSVSARVALNGNPSQGGLLRPLSVGLERVMGIEPTWPAWKAGALPLSYTRADRNTSGRIIIVNFSGVRLKGARFVNYRKIRRDLLSAGAKRSVDHARALSNGWLIFFASV